MRRGVAFVLLCVVCVAAQAERNDGAFTAAEKVLAAIAEGDDAALEALAKSDAPDPWVVVSELCRRGEHDAAVRFAKVGRRPATERLVEYVESMNGENESQEAYNALVRAKQALVSRKPDEAIAELPLPRAPTNRVTGVMLAHQEGMIRQMQDRPADAAEAYTAAAEGAASFGWLRQAGLCFAFAGRFEAKLGNSAKATALFERAVEAWEAIGFTLGVGAALTEAAMLARSETRWVEAIGYYERALRLFNKVGHEPGVTVALHHLGLSNYHFGNFQRALENYERVLPLWKKSGNRGEWAGTHINMGNVYDSLGMYAEAIRHHEIGLAEARAIGHEEYIAKGLLNLAGVYWRVGNSSRALVYTEQALAKMKSGGRPDGAARAISALGLLRADLEDFDGAMEYYNAALAQAAVFELNDLEAVTLSNMARAYLVQGEHDKSIEYYRRAHALAEEIKDRALAARCIGAIGNVLIEQGERAKGIEKLKQCEREARRLRVRSLLVWVLRLLTWVHLKDDDNASAVFRAREARAEVEHLLGGLGARDAASVRENYSTLFHYGALAATRMGDTAEALAFLESGRAGALLELLGGRHVLRWEDLPEGLRRAEREAELKESALQGQYRRAVEDGNLKKIRAAAVALEAAQARLAEVTAKIQREASRRTTTLFYPSAATLEELQGVLDPDTSFVIYGVGPSETLAIVLTSKDAKVVELGNSDDLWRVSNALVSVSDPKTDASKVLAKAKGLIVAPLALPKTTKKVLISPDYLLCNLPFAMLFDHPVALTPSGSTHSFLVRDSQDVGKGVLALGDPVYDEIGAHETQVFAARRSGAHSGKLARLPATGPEAKAVGDEILLGAQATQAELRKALAKKERWRAVHLACHGLLDPDPAKCALVLSDGFLTAREVFFMEMPADLAVLSACETAQGTQVRGEGMLGLTRSFMYAGAPRILCSLWKVDDDATMALMIKFYELWNPKDGSKGLSAAEALREAQSHVKAQKKWSHPYYWAAWVLWGLPN